MQPFFTAKFGNPSSLYKLGVEAKEALEEARSKVADVLNARPQEVVFTAGGTESVNLAILGAAKAYREKHKKGGHVITSAIEHHAVLKACEQLEAEGFKVTRLKVDELGFVHTESLKKSIRKDTFLVSIMYANNEIGSIQPFIAIRNIIKNANQNRRLPILFHSDACQATGFLDLNVQKLGVDLFSINASKIYGPKQVGCLYVRKGVVLQPLVFGGGQENELRSGTENTAGVVGFAFALVYAQDERYKEARRLIKLRNQFISKIIKKIPQVKLNGPGPELDNGDVWRRLPNNVNFTFKGAEGEAVMLYLDALNIAVSTGSACASESLDPSHVLKAIGLSDNDAKDSIRITLGKTTTKEHLDFVVKALVAVVKLVRKM